MVGGAARHATRPVGSVPATRGQALRLVVRFEWIVAVPGLVRLRLVSASGGGVASVLSRPLASRATVRVDLDRSGSLGLAHASLRALGLLRWVVVLDPRQAVGSGLGLLGLRTWIRQLVSTGLEQPPGVWLLEHPLSGQSLRAVARLDRRPAWPIWPRLCERQRRQREQSRRAHAHRVHRATHAARNPRVCDPAGQRADSSRWFARGVARSHGSACGATVLARRGRSRDAARAWQRVFLFGETGLPRTCARATAVRVLAARRTCPAAERRNGTNAAGGSSVSSERRDWWRACRATRWQWAQRRRACSCPAGADCPSPCHTACGFSASTIAIVIGRHGTGAGNVAARVSCTRAVRASPCCATGGRGR
jgi:hypothetical protein